MKTVVVTGGSSGIGRETCLLYQSMGYKVYELSRSGSSFENISHITCDVSDEESVKNAFKTVFEKENRIDILVNNAGFGISGVAEYTPVEKAKKQFDVNFFGAFLCTSQAVAYMKKNGGGCVVFVSSMAAPLSIPFQMFYSASKAAINSMTLAFANELKPFGIRVCAVMPGDVKTGFTAVREKSNKGDEEYKGILKRSVATMEHDEQTGMSPVKIAEAIVRLSQKKSPKPLSTVGLSYKLIAVLAKVLPVRTVNLLISMIYSK